MSIYDWAALILVVTALSAIVGLVILYFFHRSRSTKKPKPARSTPSWIWVFFIALLGLISYATTGDRQPGPPDPAGRLPWFGNPLWIFAATFVFFAGFVAIQLYRQYDRDASRALKKSQAGDTEGAIADLQAAMEGRKPSAIRSNMMGLLHGTRKEWAEAYKSFLEAEAIGGRQAQFLANQGVALMNLGRLEEAASLMEEACSLAPADVLMPINYGLALVGLSRFDEARDQLAKAEKNLKAIYFLPASSREWLTKEMESLRVKLSADPESRDQAVFREP